MTSLCPAGQQTCPRGAGGEGDLDPWGALSPHSSLLPRDLCSRVPAFGAICACCLQGRNLEPLISGSAHNSLPVLSPASVDPKPPQHLRITSLKYMQHCRTPRVTGKLRGATASPPTSRHTPQTNSLQPPHIMQDREPLQELPAFLGEPCPVPRRAQDTGCAFQGIVIPSPCLRRSILKQPWGKPSF